MFSINSLLFSQAPANDCANSPIFINACGTAFSITQAQMALATNDAGCAAGGSCPIAYVNGLGYSNFDCNTSTSAPSSANGDDWDGSVENSLFWSFTPTTSCNYTITITATNCCCKDKGPTIAAQYQLYGVSGPLPAGTILNYYGGSNSFTGTISQTILTTANRTVLIALDGVNGSDCDISVSVNPVLTGPNACTGCIISLPIELVDFYVENEREVNNLSWVTSSEINNDYFIIENSTDGYNWDLIKNVNGSGNSNTEIIYNISHESYKKDVNYYRLTQVDFDGKKESFKIIAIDNSKESKTIVRKVNLMGLDVDDSYSGFVILYFSDGTYQKKFIN